VRVEETDAKNTMSARTKRNRACAVELLIILLRKNAAAFCFELTIFFHLFPSYAPPTSEKGGIRIEFARTKMGEVRELD
jgi:hypothetical protein